MWQNMRCFSIKVQSRRFGGAYPVDWSMAACCSAPSWTVWGERCIGPHDRGSSPDPSRSPGAPVSQNHSFWSTAGKQTQIVISERYSDPFHIFIFKHKDSSFFSQMWCNFVSSQNFILSDRPINFRIEQWYGIKVMHSYWMLKKRCKNVASIPFVFNPLYIGLNLSKSVNIPLMLGEKNTISQLRRSL